MEFHGPDHVYRCVPNILGNRDSKAPVVLGLSVFTTPEIDQAFMEESSIRQAFASDQASEEIRKRTFERLRGKLHFIENLVVDGETIEKFEDFYAKAPNELVGWFMKAVYSTYVLTEAERKN